MDACNELLRLRRERRLTQAEVAAKAGLHLQTICRLERGTSRRGPDLGTLRRIATALDTTTEALFPELLGRAGEVSLGSESQVGGVE